MRTIASLEVSQAGEILDRLKKLAITKGRFLFSVRSLRRASSGSRHIAQQAPNISI